MKHLSGFLTAVFALFSVGAFAAPVPQTLGDNLTAYNSSGAINNNNWNNLMNNRSGAAKAPVADFGNCNALILRCAQPKCANGGCLSMDIARPIVSGCVQSNDSCKQYGIDLIDSISAQLVANSNARANQQANNAQLEAAQAAAQQSAQQLQQMQSQMQQLQYEMTQQSAQTAAQLEAALEQQRQLTAQAISNATAPAVGENNTTTGASSSQIAAAQNGVSADILVREQVSGEILTRIDNAEIALKNLKATMQDAFTYAGCDTSGNNCVGPKRVKAFKDKAMKFFDPYNNVLDELYDALISAQAVGVDITDIYMMLNGSCNAWGQYLCQANQQMHYTNTNCSNGISIASEGSGIIGNHPCKPGQVIPMSDGGCQLIKMMTNNDEIRKSWLNEEAGVGQTVRVGCASEALDNSTLFRNRKKQSSIDIETLEKIISQDAPASVRNKGNINKDFVKYCALTDASLADLQKYIATKSLPSSNICINERKLNSVLERDVFLVDSASVVDTMRAACEKQENAVFSDITYMCYCEPSEGNPPPCDSTKSTSAAKAAEKGVCERAGGEYTDSTRKCSCEKADEFNKIYCEDKFGKSK